MAIAMVCVSCGNEAPEAESEPGAGGETVATVANVALVFGRDSAESNSSVDETRITPVHVTWTDPDGTTRERTVTRLRSGEGEGSGDFATLEDLDWAEAAELLRSERPAGTTDTLYFNQGRWGWLALHLVREGTTTRLIVLRYDELSVVGTAEATFELEEGGPSVLEPPPVSP